MLTVQVHKDVTEYQPKIVGGFTGRTLACLGGAMAGAAAVGCLCALVLHIDVDMAMPLIWIGAAPACLLGFYTPHGMKFEKFLPLWWAHAHGKTLILYKTPSHRAEGAAAARSRAEAAREGLERDANEAFGKLRRKRGCALEVWSPGGSLDIPCTIHDEE